MAIDLRNYKKDPRAFLNEIESDRERVVATVNLAYWIIDNQDKYDQDVIAWAMIVLRNR